MISVVNVPSAVRNLSPISLYSHFASVSVRAAKLQIRDVHSHSLALNPQENV